MVGIHLVPLNVSERKRILEMKFVREHMLVKGGQSGRHESTQSEKALLLSLSGRLIVRNSLVAVCGPFILRAIIRCHVQIDPTGLSEYGVGDSVGHHCSSRDRTSWFNAGVFKMYHAQRPRFASEPGILDNVVNQPESNPGGLVVEV